MLAWACRFRSVVPFAVLLFISHSVLAKAQEAPAPRVYYKVEPLHSALGKSACPTPEMRKQIELRVPNDRRYEIAPMRGEEAIRDKDEAGLLRTVLEQLRDGNPAPGLEKVGNNFRFQGNTAFGVAFYYWTRDERGADQSMFFGQPTQGELKEAFYRQADEILSNACLEDFSRYDNAQVYLGIYDSQYQLLPQDEEQAVADDVIALLLGARVKTLSIGKDGVLQRGNRRLGFTIFYSVGNRKLRYQASAQLAFHVKLRRHARYLLAEDVKKADVPEFVENAPEDRTKVFTKDPNYASSKFPKITGREFAATLPHFSKILGLITEANPELAALVEKELDEVQVIRLPKDRLFNSPPKSMMDIIDHKGNHLIEVADVTFKSHEDRDPQNKRNPSWYFMYSLLQGIRDLKHPDRKTRALDIVNRLRKIEADTPAGKLSGKSEDFQKAVKDFFMKERTLKYDVFRAYQNQYQNEQLARLSQWGADPELESDFVAMTSLLSDRYHLASALDYTEIVKSVSLRDVLLREMEDARDKKENFSPYRVYVWDVIKDLNGEEIDPSNYEEIKKALRSALGLVLKRGATVEDLERFGATLPRR